MSYQEYPVFQKIDESKNFSLKNSRSENKALLFSYIRQQEPLFTKTQIWGAPSIYYLQYLLKGLYDLEEAYSRYEKLTSLEKHGIAHLIISLSAPYFEKFPAVILAHPKKAPIRYIIYMSANEFTANEFTANKKKYRKLWRFNPATCEKKQMREYIEKDVKFDEFKIKHQNKLDFGENIYWNEQYFTAFDTNYIDYFGNYIHQNVKNKLEHQEEWEQIRKLRNRLAHPHEGISEPDLKRACDLLCCKEFIEDIEALVFLLSPLTPENRQLFCQYGYHNNKEKFVRTRHFNFIVK